MPFSIGTPGPAGPLYGNDPRASLVPNSASDQLAKLQTLADLHCQRTLQAGDRPIVLLPGEYRKNGEVLLAPTDGHRPPTIRGYGGMGDRDAPTVIVDTADAGSGKWSLKKTGSAFYEFADLVFFGQGPSLVPGHPGWNMRGVHANGRGRVRGVSVLGGYQAGISIDGDHHDIQGCILNGNVYGIEWPAGSTSQGDILLRKVQADGCSKAGIGIAQGVVMAGVTWDHGSMGQAPYGVLRYTVPGQPTVTGDWMTGCVFNTIATEFCGNGVVYDEVQDGAGISDIDWIGNGVDWGLFNGSRAWQYNSESRPQVAAWYTAGSISDFRVHKGFPGLTNGLPSFKAANIVNFSAPNSGRFVLPKIIAGERPFEITGSGFLPNCSIGRSSDILIVPYVIATGTVARGELLTNNNEQDARKYAGSGRVIGVCTHASTAATSSKVQHALKTGNTSDTVFKNTSGVTIAPNTLLKPHASGGVQAASSMTDGQVIGRSTASGADGALFAAEMFGML